MPNSISVVDRTKAQRIYFLVGTADAPILGGTPLRTRWISPSGDEVKVIDSKVLTLGLQKSGIFLYESATHSIPRELFLLIQACEPVTHIQANSATTRRRSP